MVAEWNKSVSTEATLVKLVTASVMVVAAIGGWRRSASESYPDPVLAKSLSLKIFIGVDLGILTIPFCEKLCDYYRVSICNLHPNSVLAVSIFITLCESYLDI
jgi:hypothetical protein